MAGCLLPAVVVRVDEVAVIAAPSVVEVVGLMTTPFPPVFVRSLLHETPNRAKGDRQPSAHKQPHERFDGTTSAWFPPRADGHHGRLTTVRTISPLPRPPPGTERPRDPRTA